MKKLIGGVLLLMGLFIISIVNTYESSPGFTSQVYAQEFYENKPKCYGLSILLNKKATWADAPGRSLCIGILNRY